MASEHPWENVLVEFDEGIAWVALNRPAKRNAMSPALNREMVEVLDMLETDERCRVVVLTGAGDSFSAGMDLKEYFRETDQLAPAARYRVYRDAGTWQWRRLRLYPKATIAMVNGWCFGGAFTPLIACDLAIAADEATFGLSEINWGIIPAGVVTKAVVDTMSLRDAMYYVMTGETFDGKKASEMRLVNEVVAPAALMPRALEVAAMIARHPPTAVRVEMEALELGQEMNRHDAAHFGQRLYRLHRMNYQGYGSAEGFFADRAKAPRE